MNAFLNRGIYVQNTHFHNILLQCTSLLLWCYAISPMHFIFVITMALDHYCHNRNSSTHKDSLYTVFILKHIPVSCVSGRCTSMDIVQCIGHYGSVTAYGDMASVSALARIMACCLTAPFHYVHQYWHIINEISWHSHQDNFTRYS